MAFAALAVVLGLIWLAQLLARGGVARGGLARGVQARLLGGTGDARLAVARTLALDPRRRLHLVRCEGRQVLLLTGGAQDIVVGWLPPGAGDAP
ncbi:MAG: hypothetical protein BGP12_15620 [Rhodospirillales bacterium 70-18]|nr:MAG: hypothetical protein BGP12_15620 [Rhodospirillales bacterium 70-18]